MILGSVTGHVRHVMARSPCAPRDGLPQGHTRRHNAEGILTVRRAVLCALAPQHPQLPTIP